MGLGGAEIVIILFVALIGLVLWSLWKAFWKALSRNRHSSELEARVENLERELNRRRESSEPKS